MKKRLTILVAAMAVCALLMTMVTGTTLAKYVTNGSGSDSARVAAFGVTVETTGNMFATQYNKTDSSFTLAGQSVVSTGKVVAPGTNGAFAGFTVTGTPEVAVRVVYKNATLTLSGWADSNNAYYCPLEITVGTTTMRGNDYASAAEFKAAVEAAINAYTVDYAAGTNLATATAADNPGITWEWKFAANDDVKDTFLGDQAAANNASTVALALTLEVTQID